MKRILIITLVLATYHPQSIQAMEEGSTLTEIAEDKEKEEGKFVSPQGLIYRRTKLVKQRIPHIKLHLGDNMAKRKHTFFKTGTVVYNDIIGFIDIIFSQWCTSNRLDIRTTDRTRNLELGTINLPTTTHSDTKEYKVILNYNSQNGQHIYEIVPASQDLSYPAIGTQGGSKGNRSDLRGYRLSLTYTTAGPEIETLCLSELTL